MNKTKDIKIIAKQLDFTKYLTDNPTSGTLKRAVKKQKEVLENNLEETKLLEVAGQLKHRIWILVNKSPYVTDEKERENFNEAINKLAELTEEKIKN